MSKAYCQDCHEHVPNLNAYLYESHDKPILCKFCSTRRNNTCLFCEQFVKHNMGYWSDYDKHKICYKCNEQRIAILSHIEDAYKPDFRNENIEEVTTQNLPVVKITETILKPVDELLFNFDFVDEKKKSLKEKSDKHLKDAEEQVANAQKLLQEAQVLNQKLRDLFKDK